ncbi:BTAD domain-containing putative transcriptional regulator [Streptomyces sp. NPDC048219]|uniref:AfsR/SARP family transcriptional regulator n=1 Tax=Streptomyces sp. NPDC048219 TaxID=3365517 RepID=UPI003721CE0A
MSSVPDVRDRSHLGVRRRGSSPRQVGSLFARLLGPLTVGTGKRESAPTSNREKQMLALLLLNLPHVTSTGLIIDELWTENPPKTAMTTLQTYILHLRKFLAETMGVSARTVAKEYLVHRSGGYVFVASQVDLDVEEFRALERRAHMEVDLDDYQGAVRTAESALSLWHGQALMDVQAGQYIQAEIHGLEQARLSLIEEKIEAEMVLGRDRKVLGELSTLVTRYPLHEGLNSSYIRALANSGYRTRALEVYQDLRAVMVDQIGLEPSAELRELHEAILTDRLPRARTERRRGELLRHPA